MAERPSGLSIANVAVHLSPGHAWPTLPGRPMIDTATGVVLPDDSVRLWYASVLSWRSRDLADRWSSAVVALICRSAP